MDIEQITQMYDFTGKTFIMTGGSGMLGTDIMLALAGLGANVAIFGRNLNSSQEVVDRRRPTSDRGLAVQGDVLDRSRLVAAAATVTERFGGIDGKEIRDWAWLS
jgi:NAD(P)-dependent dehydrogenase (short-subunit alcohol dehydrogenase family)